MRSRARTGEEGAAAGGGGGAEAEVLVDAAGQVAQAAVAEQRDLVVGDPLEEVPVVGDDDEGAGPAVEDVLEGGQRVDVEVVGRLVEDEHVRLGHQQAQQLQPPPLPARQVARPASAAGAPVNPSRVAS